MLALKSFELLFSVQAFVAFGSSASVTVLLDWMTLKIRRKRNYEKFFKLPFSGEYY